MKPLCLPEEDEEICMIRPSAFSLKGIVTLPEVTSFLHLTIFCRTLLPVKTLHFVQFFMYLSTCYMGGSPAHEFLNEGLAGLIPSLNPVLSL